jgi:uncharacterized protein YjiS (DUF1127 family)
MSISTIEIRAPESDSRGAAVARSIARRISRIGSRRRLLRDVDDLTALGDHMLADIGLSRSEIAYVALHGEWFDRETDRRCL